MPDSDTEGEEPDIESIVQRDPLLHVFGDTARGRIIRALLITHRPMNPSDICRQSNLSRSSFYRNIDDLLETGIVVEADETPESTLYAIVDDEVREALELLGSWASVGLYHMDKDYGDLRGAKVQNKIREGNGTRE
jgi:DNA-binding transcriptional ArsR family regulator